MSVAPKKKAEPEVSSDYAPGTLNMMLPSIQQVVVKHVIKRPKSKGKPSKTVSQGKSGSKENNSTTFRMRKIVINHKSNYTPVARAETSLGMQNHNLLVDRKDIKLQQLAPLKQKKTQRKKDRSISVKSPRILSRMNLNNMTSITGM